MHDDMKKEYPTSPQAVYFLSCSALPLMGLKIQNMPKAKVWNMAQDIAWCLSGQARQPWVLGGPVYGSCHSSPS